MLRKGAFLMNVGMRMAKDFNMMFSRLLPACRPIDLDPPPPSQFQQ
jgi:hypothetical protein